MKTLRKTSERFDRQSADTGTPLVELIGRTFTTKKRTIFYYGNRQWNYVFLELPWSEAG